MSLPVVFSLILDVWFLNALSPKKNAFTFLEIVMVMTYDGTPVSRSSDFVNHSYD